MKDDEPNIDKYIQSHLIFESGEPLELLTLEKPNGNQIALAASGNSVNNVDYQRIGMLANSGQSVLARIFHSKSQQEYRLYFLNEEGRSLTGSIVTSKNTFKYFFVDEGQYAVIPEKTQIDPLNDSLMLVSPEAHVTIAGREWKDDSDKILAGDGDYLIQVQYQELQGESDESTGYKLHCTLMGEFQKGGPTKVLYRQESIFRLVPMRNRNATIRLSQITTDPLDLYFYK